MRKLLFMTAMVAFILTPSAWAADINGTWTVTWWGAGAEESFPVDIKAAGETLTITGTHPGFGEMTGTGTLKGNDVSMTLTSASMDIALTGKLTGQKMEGTREIKSAGGGGRDGGAPEGGGAGGPQGDMGGAPAGAAGGPQGDMGGAPQGDQGADAAGGNENWVAIKG